jgi:hypothetical protein
MDKNSCEEESMAGTEEADDGGTSRRRPLAYVDASASASLIIRSSAATARDGQ